MKLFMSIIMTMFLLSNVHAKKIVLTDKNTVVMDSSFRSSSVAIVQQKLAELSLKSNQDLYLVLNSPGGSISAGQRLIDYARSLPNKVHTITIFAASMAYLTAQHLDKRYILPGGRMMSHRARISGLSGQVPGEANARLNHINHIVRDLFKSTAKRVGVPYKQYLGSVYNELWLTSSQAVALNHADAIVDASCDKSLSGTYEKMVNTFFGSFKVTFSKCPLITGSLKVEPVRVKSRKIINNHLNYTNNKDFELVP